MTEHDERGPELPADLAATLRRARQAGPDAAARARMAANLAARTGGGGGGDRGPAPRSRARRAAAAGLALVGLLALGGGFLVVGGSGPAGRSPSTPNAEARASLAEAPDPHATAAVPTSPASLAAVAPAPIAPAPIAPAPVAPAPIEPAPIAPAPIAPAERVDPPELRQPDAQPSAAPPSEIELLDAAHAALATRPSRALRDLQRHASLYPHGVYEEEREVLAVEALLALDRPDDARARAHRFLAAHPTSAHRSHLDELLAR